MSILESLVSIPAISRVRRNHGLEHATLHVLSQRFPRVSMAGHSDMRGFWLLGDVSLEAVQESIEEALARMRAGEHDLAVHEHCGTNFVTAGIMAGLAAGGSMFGVGRRFRDKLERLPLAVMMATVALIFSQPLGLLFQERVTTSGQPGNLEVLEITASKRGRINAYRVVTRG
ncbi:MAG TPA: DUF6391 domain-containing protein [Anaerolineales bacterium]|jgi:hypothetical protein|nr:DUF6391 domain-containing protein [Anaerolineales bacterium]